MDNDTVRVYLGQELSQDNQITIDSIINDQKPAKIVTFVNADFTDEEDMPGGMVALFKADSPIHVDSIPQETFMYTAVTKVLAKPDGGEWEDKDFTGVDKEMAVGKAVPQFSSDPPQLKSYNDGSPKDDKVWNAELGSQDCFAGVFKKVDGNDARQADSTYYIVTQSSVPIVAQQLRQKLIKHPEMTYKDLLSDEDFIHAHYVAERNAARLAFQVARALKVPVRHGQDRGMMLSEEYSTPGMRARLNMSQPVSVIKEHKGDVAVFNKIRPIEDACKTCLVYAGPYEGVAMFNMDGKGKGIGLPANTGRNQQGLDPNTRVDYKKRSKGITWEGKDLRNPIHPDLHPDAFNPVNSEVFLDQMERMGWSQRGTDTRHTLIPVNVKIFNPEIARKR